VLTLALSPDARYLISGGEDATVRLWNTATFQPVGATVTLPATVRAVAWSADGQTLATATAAGAVQLWHVTLPK
jgi:WD40 repeat protein